YSENVLIYQKNNLSVIGIDGASVTKIRGVSASPSGPSDGAVGVRSSTAVLIKNFTIYPSDPPPDLDAGIYIEFSSSNVTVEDNIIANFSCVPMRGAIVDGKNCTVRGNTFINAGLLIWVLGSVVEDNVVNGKPLVYLEDVSDTVVGEAGEVILINCDGVRVENLTLTNSTVGIQLCWTHNTEIVGNNIANSDYGVYQYQSSNISIHKSNLTHNIFGLYAISSSNTTLSSNRFADNRVDGIRFIRSSANIIGNSLARNRCGIMLSGCDGNTILGNTIEDSFYGVWMAQSSGLTFYHNNFVNNTQPVYFSPTSPSVNPWDNGCEGNYWSDYEERYPGATYDYYHIWDTPYVIDESNQDDYPMQNPYWNPGDINNDLKVDIYDVVLVAQAYESTPSDKHWNPHCDIAEPYGIIDIYDIVIAAGNYDKSW
ncbi:MAG: right-handed parallel beta-helix repeat-containing protein, partial [Candidatus Bathyarchaeota archaeon]